MIEDGFKEYPHIPLIESMKPTKRVLLGQRLFWTHKKDGSNVSIQCVPAVVGKDECCLPDGIVPLISSRNMADASSDIKALVFRTEEYGKILELIQENPNFICYVEACRKGLSVTRVESYERDMLFLFDIFDKRSGKFLPYTIVHQMAYHYQIPVVKLWTESRHVTEESLMAQVDECLNYCRENHLEGMVIKAYGELPEKIAGYYKEYSEGIIMAKVKQDIPKREKLTKPEEGNPQYPPCPESEVFGAIAKVDADVGLTGESGHDMPLIAQYVKEECKKHLYSSPIRKLFAFYEDYKAQKAEQSS